MEKGKDTMYFKSKDEVMNKLRNDLTMEKARLSAWENVSVLRKKDGSEFAQIGKAISGAKLDKQSIPADAEHPYIFLHYCAEHKYQSDWIPAFWYLDELPESDPRRSAYRKQFVRQTCPMTADEVREAIAKRVSAVREYVEQFEQDISVAEETYNAFREAMHNAETVLRSAGSNHLYYAIKDAVSF